jgi:probable sporulation protein (polysaccharide deacetylase family)
MVKSSLIFAICTSLSITSYVLVEHVFSPSPLSSIELERQTLELRSIITQHAKITNIASINAKIDPVWKAIPGYNGLEVDIEATLAQTLLRKERIPSEYIYKEIEPSIQLEDLGVYPIYRGNSQKSMVSLMINVAWGNDYIPHMLEILKNEQVKATFFFDGTWLNKHLDLAKKIAQDGHELSNHAYSHRNMSQLSQQKVMEEITKTQDILVNQLHVKNHLFAPPSGDFNQQTIDIAKKMGLYTVLWTLDTVDWKNPGAEAIIQKINHQLVPGALILMHPTQSSSQALETMIQNIKQKNMFFGTVSELISSKRVPALTKENSIN